VICFGREQISPYRLDPCLAPLKVVSVAKSTPPTDRYKVCVKGRGLYSNLIDLSKSYPNFGTVVFKEQLFPENQFYSMKSGVGFSHSNVIYSNSNHNITTALPRILGFDRKGYKMHGGACIEYSMTEDECRTAQLTFTKSRRWRRRVDELKKSFSAYVNQHSVNWNEERHRWCQLPHVKRALRLQGLKKIDDNMEWCRGNGKGKGWKASCKLKIGEWAKYGKKARNILDLGVESSLYGGYAAEFVKKWLTTHTKQGKCDVMFMGDPSFEKLKEMFGKLEKPEYLVMPFFSDDACLAIKCRDGVFRCNTDFVSADSSHYQPVFDALLEITGGNGELSEHIRIAVEQLSAKIIVKDCYGRGVMSLQTFEPVLLSGSVLTTMINNIGQLMFACKLASVNWSEKTISDALKLVPVLATQVGYTITVDDATKHKALLQFLKFSPDEHNRPFINLGVFIRALGHSKRDVPRSPGRKKKSDKRVRLPYLKRALSYEASKVAGFKNFGRSPLYDLFAEKYGSSDAEVEIEKFYAYKDGMDFQVPLDYLMFRYGEMVYTFNSLQAEVVNAFETEDYFAVIRHPLIDTIMMKDYGAPPPDIQSLCPI